MSSVIEGYNYDIFISYRQKDNKHDGWVTEFVNNLKAELESTFKEEISVYFDINPHDGLLETHDVDESLKEKLKCLIFIPVISRTYCDTKSFAWGHEFKAFVEMASKDQFGLKVKLPNGNVASRVMPVQIHEIDTEDKELVEDELGGHFRGIEFIYKEPGVNRPLTLKDNEDKNINKTNYRNQVNKVANAVKEIISGVKGSKVRVGQTISEDIKPVKARSWGSMIIAGLILTGLLLAGIITILKIIRHSKTIETSIAVLPFTNDSPDRENDYIVNGVFDEIINDLQKIKSFSRVLPRNSVEKYRNSIQSSHEIAKELNVNYLLSGTAQVIENTLKLNITLVNAREDRIIKTFTPQSKKITPEEIFRIYGEIAKSVADELNTQISPEERKIIERPSTLSISAYSSFQRADDELSNFTSFTNYSFDLQNLLRAEVLFKLAIQEDTGFADAYTGLANVLLNKQNYKEYATSIVMDSVLLLLERAVSINKNSDWAHVCLGDYYDKKGLKNQALKEYDLALGINPNSWNAYYSKGKLYYLVDNLECIKNHMIAASLNHGKEYQDIMFQLSLAYATAGFTKEANHINGELIKSLSDSLNYLLWAGTYEKDKGNYAESINIFNRLFQKDSTQVFMLQFLAEDYYFLGRYRESIIYFWKNIEQSKRIGFIVDDETNLFLVYSLMMTGAQADLQGVRKRLEAKQSELTTNNPQYAKETMYILYYDLAALNTVIGDRSNAYMYLAKFNSVQSIPLFMVTRLKDDPMFTSIRSEPEFKSIFKNIESKYLNEHERIRKWLGENSLL